MCQEAGLSQEAEPLDSGSQAEPGNQDKVLTEEPGFDRPSHAIETWKNPISSQHLINRTNRYKTAARVHP